jgi:hypothetical protein
VIRDAVMRHILERGNRIHLFNTSRKSAQAGMPVLLEVDGYFRLSFASFAHPLRFSTLL